jgi:ribosomal protein S25
LDDALDKFGNKDSKTWSDDEKKKDRKALSHIHLHLSNNILQEVLQEKTIAALWLKLESICVSKDLTSRMHMKMKLYTQVARRWLCLPISRSLRRLLLTYSLWR